MQFCAVLPQGAGLGVVGEGSLSLAKAVPGDMLDDCICNPPLSDFLLDTSFPFCITVAEHCTKNGAKFI